MHKNNSTTFFYVISMEDEDGRLLKLNAELKLVTVLKTLAEDDKASASLRGLRAPGR